MHPDRVENSTPPIDQASNPKDIAGQSKCPLHLLPGVADVQIAWALAHGAEKYGGWNWRTSPIQATAYIAAARRHLAAWTDGEDCDSESGRSHLAHVAATMAILLDAMACGTLRDDRPKNGMVAKLLATSVDTTPQNSPSAACFTLTASDDSVHRVLIATQSGGSEGA